MIRIRNMRTTIEIDDEHRAKLLEIAARRGLKGFSQIVAEAIDSYLAAENGPEKRREEVRRLQGSLSPKEAEDLRRRVAKIHKFWR
jgi:metal-responsive CopG/Arc/MetJ family transcriptional regulator